MGKPVDEILTALPELGFLVWRMDQNTVGGHWHVCIEDAQADPLAHYSGDGADAAAALIDALAKAGVDVEDDGT